MTLEPVADGFQSPVAAVAARDGSNRIFVVEKGGAIRIVRDGAVVPNAFLDISGAVSGGGEQGLLGLAFHPDFPDDPRFFVNYTDTSGDTRVSSFTVDPSNPDRADPDSEVELLFIDQPYGNHNGGALAFGPDGYLYIGMGDGGSGGDPHGNGQKLGTLLGKVLRIDVDSTTGDQAYGIPADNPFASTASALPGDLRPGPAKPVAALVRPGDRRPVDRRRRPGRLGGDRRRTGRDVRGELRLEPDGGQPLLPAVRRLRRVGTDAAGDRVLARQRRLHGDRRLRLPRDGPARPGRRRTSSATTARGRSGRSIRPAMSSASRRSWSESGATISSFGEDEAGELYVTDLSSGQLLRVVASRS